MHLMMVKRQTKLRKFIGQIALNLWPKKLDHYNLGHFIIKNFLYMLLNPPRSHSLLENLQNQIQLIYEKERLVAQGVMLWFYSFFAFAFIVSVWHFSVGEMASVDTQAQLIESAKLFVGLVFFALIVLLPVAFFSLQQARQNRAILNMCANYILAFSAGATAKLSSEIAKQGLPIEYADVSSWMTLD
jgi:pilus assembly protein TadC